uniref:(northern house mosquito) hypothetical protein n=2 Tax=Culex pipiens TaxID=7175 RepID=A0A8D8FTC0_CULPI
MIMGNRAGVRRRRHRSAPNTLATVTGGNRRRREGREDTIATRRVGDRGRIGTGRTGIDGRGTMIAAGTIDGDRGRGIATGIGEGGITIEIGIATVSIVSVGLLRTKRLCT